MNDIFNASFVACIQNANSECVQPSSFTAEGGHDFQCIALGGDFYSPSGTIGRQFSPLGNAPIDLAKALEASGEWLGVFRKETPTTQEYIVVGDPLGYCPVFYAQTPGGLMVCDSFPALSAALQRAGVAPAFNLPYYIASILNKHPHFDNPHLGTTMHEGVYILPPDRAIYVTPEGWSIVNRKQLYSPGIINNYDELIHRGINSATGTVQALASGQSQHLGISLSGGVDSRLALSLIISSGMLNQFSVTTMDPRKWSNSGTQQVIDRDMSIADQIRREHGLDWSIDGERCQLDFDFWDALELYAGYRSNFSYSFAPMNSFTVFNDKRVTVRGGGGEMLRTTLTGARVTEAVERRSSSQASGNDEALTAWYLASGQTPKAFRNIVSAQMEIAFSELPGQTVEEKMNFQYLFGRNRTHFGHGRISAAGNNAALHLLSNPYFILARDEVTFDERKNGKIVKDIFERTNPGLLETPFENDASTAQLCTPPLKEIASTNEAWTDSIDAAKLQQGKVTRLPSWDAGRRGVHSPYNGQIAAGEFIRRGFRLLEDQLDNPDRKAIQTLHFEALRRADKSARILFSTVGKLASALDVFSPNVSDPKVIDLQTVVQPAEQRLKTFAPPLRSSISDGWHNSSISGICVDLYAEKENLIVEVTSDFSESDLGELAVYLYLNGHRIDKSWFARDRRRVFRAKNLKGSAQAEVFVKKTPASQPSYGFRSAPIIVGMER